MPRLIKRKKTDVNVEKRIITGMIVSKEYMQSIYPLIDLSYFKSSFTKKLASWTIEFYETYEEVPFDDIQSIFNAEEPTMKEEESKLISKLLARISKRYEREKGLNLPYLLDQTEKYFKTRELEITAGNLKVFLEKGDIRRAEDQISSFRKIQKLTSEWIDPFDNEEIDDTFNQMGEDFFRLPGKLGEFLGSMERDWLIGISGAFKKGKTWFLQEFELMGILSNLKVAHFSLEMNKQQTKERLYRRITGGYEEGERLQYPCFDCTKNQDNSCELSQRVCNELIPDEFQEDGDYLPCTACRGDGTNNYEKASWLEMLKAPPFDVNTVGKSLEAWQKSYNDLLRIKIYPRFSANLSDIRRDLDLLEQLEDFVPDIILIDYADILKPEDDNSIGIDKEDRTWIALSQLAAERHALVVAPTQVTKSGQDVSILKVEHTAKWVGKLGHVDAMFTLNQDDIQKVAGVMNVGIMLHRHKEFNPEAAVTILQKLMVGQANLDSEI